MEDTTTCRSNVSDYLDHSGTLEEARHLAAKASTNTAMLSAWITQQTRGI